ncbi:hypothetical protein ElyMa_001754500 [Elysia marginata]|uniref:DRBM domain-containing protein n=1 Tax=Elysia marginata TaxID=1093978 RepID=A0AAV4EAH2_9GAST|nr:hypothetical protein ElyMa_001754500 [Elysia marginata]
MFQTHQPNEYMTITCDLYLCERFLAQGKGTNRKLAQTYAYKRACEILRNMASAEDILALSRIDKKELKMPDVIDIVHKGYQVVEESNLCRMNRTKQPPLEHRNLNSFIILEHEDWSRDRKKHAHCILTQSATQCGCLLEWRSEPSGRGYRCTMTLQGEQVASCVTYLRKDAVRIASIIALFTFYETHPVVQGFHIDYPAVWTTRDQLMATFGGPAASALTSTVGDAVPGSPDDGANKPPGRPSHSNEDDYKLEVRQRFWTV